MAAALQKEMKVSITVVATKTLITGRCRFGAVVDIVVAGVMGGAQAASSARQEYISVQPLPPPSQRFLAGLSAVVGPTESSTAVLCEYCEDAEQERQPRAIPG